MAEQQYIGYVDQWDGQRILGWAGCYSNQAEKPYVFILADGVVIDCVYPYMYRKDIQDTYGGDGMNGFVASIPLSVIKFASQLEVVFSNGMQLSNSPIFLRRQNINRRVRNNPADRLFQDDGLIFLHIQKSAGTSLRQIFESHFDEGRIIFLYPDPPGMTRQQFLAIPLIQRAKLNCVFGHEYYGIHEFLPGTWRYATVLREPLTRIISNYYHHYKTLQGKVTLMEAVEKPTNVEFDNYMVRVLAGASEQTVPIGSVNETTLSLALENVARHFSFVGFVENSHGMAEGLSKLLDRPSISLPMENIGAYNHSILLSDDEISIIRDRNKFDVQLYEILTGGGKTLFPFERS